MMLIGLGSWLMDRCASIGHAVGFLGQTIRWGIPLFPLSHKSFWRNLLNLGFFSIPLLGCSGCFTGMVFGLQTHTGFAQFGVEKQYVPWVVVFSMVREIGPVLSGLLMAGRCGSAMAADLAHMATTEQLDAFKSLNVDPLGYTVFPRILAFILVMPFLSILFASFALLGSALMLQHRFGVEAQGFLYTCFDVLLASDWMGNIYKAITFALVIGWISCWCGVQTQRQSLQLGDCVTQAVILSSLVILITNMFWTCAWFYL